ncbi:MAG: Mur ligase family protein [Gammaproteobacteria bacterium]|tara:strand:+ start:22956 stop:24350 length:1395 start_codon:yes stop_codon:yes gene_type:complete
MKNPFLNLDSNENLVSNSNYLNKGDVFLSIKGGVKFLNNEDISKAKSIFIDQEDIISSNPKFQKIKDLNKHYIEWVDEYYGIKHSKFDNIFITGTNGKTSTVDFLSQIFKYNGLDYSSSGTLGTYLNQKKLFNNQLTTEDALFIRRLMSLCKKEDIKNIFFEASSIGIDQGRLQGLSINHAILTNISRDHIDYHGSMEEYINAKFKLLLDTKLKTISLNIDDEIIQNNKKRILIDNVFTLSAKDRSADIFFQIKEKSRDGCIKFDTTTPWGSFQSQSRVHSKFNIYNLLLTLPYFQAVNNNCDNFFDALEGVVLPKGRLDEFRKNIYIDYAHSPKALEEVCLNLREKNPKSLAIVFGAGGDRDIGKRKIMGEIADKYCDKIFITSDNPRFENPRLIAEMIQEGILNTSKVTLQLDRSLAIEEAINDLKDEEILLIAGKGHEKYQAIENKVVKYSDYEEVKKCTA